MNRLRKFRSLTRREKEFLCEAGILLVLSNACLKAVAFKYIDRFLRTRWSGSIPDDTDREQDIKLVQQSIFRAANVLPWKSLCLSQSIAQFIMLRRRSIPAILFAGARFSDQSSLTAHAWVDIGVGTQGKSSENSGFATVIMIGTRPVDG